MQHPIFEAEAVGVLLSLHMLSFEQNTRKAIIWLDNQAVLGALGIHKPKPAQSIIDEILQQTEDGGGQRTPHSGFG